jgi:hypothetical protein
MLSIRSASGIACCFLLFVLFSAFMPPEKPRFSMPVIEKRLTALFKEQKWYEGAELPWTAPLTTVGKTPENKILLAQIKKNFRFQCTEEALGGLETPRHLADRLFEILNNGVYFYEKSNFEGPAFILYTPARKISDLTMEARFLNGSCIKPAGYELKLEIGPNVFVKLGPTNAQWDTPNIREKLPEEALGKKTLKWRISR